MFRWMAQVEKNKTLIFLQEAVLISVNNLMSMLFALCCLELNRRRRYYSMFLTFHFALQWMDATMKFKLDVFSSRYKYYVNIDINIGKNRQARNGSIPTFGIHWRWLKSILIKIHIAKALNFNTTLIHSLNWKQCLSWLLYGHNISNMSGCGVVEELWKYHFCKQFYHLEHWILFETDFFLFYQCLQQQDGLSKRRDIALTTT